MTHYQEVNRNVIPSFLLKWLPLIIVSISLIAGWVTLQNRVDAIDAEQDRQNIKIEKADVTQAEILTRLSAIDVNLQWIKSKFSQ